MSKKSPLIHTPIATKRGTITQRLEKIEETLDGLAQSLPKMISAGCLAASQQIYEQLYNDLAREHGLVFEVQERGMMVIAETLDNRLRQLEESAGISAPALQQLRDIVNAIGEAGDTSDAPSGADDASMDGARATGGQDQAAISEPPDQLEDFPVARTRGEQGADVRAFAKSHGGGISKSTFPDWSESVPPVGESPVLTKENLLKTLDAIRDGK